MKRVNGKPKLVKQVYLGLAEEIYRRLILAQAPETLEVEKLAFGSVAVLWDQVQCLELREIIDEVVPQESGQQISVGTYLVVGLINRALDPTSKNDIPPGSCKTILPRLSGLPAEAFDSQSFWDAMDLVTELLRGSRAIATQYQISTSKTRGRSAGGSPGSLAFSGIIIRYLDSVGRPKYRPKLATMSQPKSLPGAGLRGGQVSNLGLDKINLS